MLPAGNRMRSSVDFAAAIRRGRRAGRRTLVLHYRPGTSGVPGPVGLPSVPSATEVSGPLERPTRVGLVVSRAVGGSVVRNRVKRKLRHLMAGRLAVLEPGSLLVVRANPASGEDDAQLGKDLDSALSAVTKAVSA